MGWFSHTQMSEVPPWFSGTSADPGGPEADGTKLEVFPHLGDSSVQASRWRMIGEGHGPNLLGSKRCRHAFTR